MKPRAPFLARVFWPEAVAEGEESGDDALSSAPSGFLVGWNVSEFTCCVLALVDAAKEEALSAALTRLAKGGVWGSTFGARGSATSGVGAGGRETTTSSPAQLTVSSLARADPTLAELRAHCAGPPLLLGEWTDGTGARRSAAGKLLGCSALVKVPMGRATHSLPNRLFQLDRLGPGAPPGRQPMARSRSPAHEEQAPVAALGLLLRLPVQDEHARNILPSPRRLSLSPVRRRGWRLHPS